MKKDDTILEATKITKGKFEKRYSVEISEEEILDIVDSQINGIVYGLKKGISIQMPILGRFLYVDKKQIKQDIYRLLNLREFYSEIEFNQKVLESKLATIKRVKEKWLRDKAEKLTVIKLIQKEDISTSKIIYDRLSKLVAEENNEDIDESNVDKYKRLYGK